MDDNTVTSLIIGAAIEVHRVLGPGLLESAYASALEQEFKLREIYYEREKVLPVVYKGYCLDAGFRLDFLVMNQIVVEIKSVQVLAPIHQAQVINYLKLTGCDTGLLINFNVRQLIKGLQRLKNPDSKSR